MTYYICTDECGEPPAKEGDTMSAEDNGYKLGDVNAAIGGAIASGLTAHTNRTNAIGEMSMNRLDALAQKSAFEVDASETGLTNANYPRTTGGNTPPGPTVNAG